MPMRTTEAGGIQAWTHRFTCHHFRTRFSRAFGKTKSRSGRAWNSLTITAPAHLLDMKIAQSYRRKDVDGFHPVNLGKFNPVVQVLGVSWYTLGVQVLPETYGLSPSGKTRRLRVAPILSAPRQHTVQKKKRSPRQYSKLLE
jgi:hypothetical protein